MPTEGVHASVKAIQDMEAACARFSRAVVDRLPEIARGLRQVTEGLNDRRSRLRREIADLEEQISSADEDDDKSWERQRAEEVEDELKSVCQLIRRLEEVGANYARHARRAETLANDHTLRMRQFLVGATDDLRAYFAKDGAGDFNSSGKALESSSNDKFDPVHSSADDSVGNDRPELEAIANNPVIRAAIDAAWEKSKPHIIGERKETGFWILRDNETGEFSPFQFVHDEATNHSIVPGVKPNIPGKTTVALFHTHPNTKEERFVQGPSTPDILFVYNPAINIPGILRAHDRLHYFGPQLPSRLPNSEISDSDPLS